MNSLKGQFLVAMPDMGDPRFRDTVIYMVGHGDEGAMGLVVNQGLEDMHFSDILEELNLGEKDEIIRLPDTVRYDANPMPDGTIALILFAVVLLIWLIPTPNRPETIVTETAA